MNGQEKSSGFSSGWTTWIVVCACLLVGCQTGHKALQNEATQRIDFESVWSKYKACRSSTDLGKVTREAALLDGLTHTREPYLLGARDEEQKFRISSFFEPSKPRLSVDPQIMAIDCWLHAGHVATSRGNNELAHHLYSRVLRSPQNPETRYYRAVAEASLIRLQGMLHAASLNTPTPHPN